MLADGSRGEVSSIESSDEWRSSSAYERGEDTLRFFLCGVLSLQASNHSFGRTNATHKTNRAANVLLVPLNCLATQSSAKTLAASSTIYPIPNENRELVLDRNDSALHEECQPTAACSLRQTESQPCHVAPSTRAPVSRPL